MRVRLTRLSDQRHVLEIERADGTRERAELETRSTLHHDLTHFALEEAAGLAHGFFPALAAGSTLAELAGRVDERAPQYHGESLAVERAVAVLQRLARQDEDPAALHARLVELAAVQGETLPPWFTRELVTRVREGLRQLLGRWRKTPYGGVLELTWTGPAAGPVP
ncbi:MAG TPA: hypothetical protein VF530_07380 [Planctomycetota bacterium]